MSESPPDVDARFVLDALLERHDYPEWVCFPELTFRAEDETDCWNRRVDLWCYRLYGVRRGRRAGDSTHRVVSYEIKVNKSDWNAEMREPMKRKPAQRRSSEFYFAVPARMVRTPDCPEDCGLMWIYEDGSTRMIKRSPDTECELDLNQMFFARIIRRCLDKEV